MVLVMFNQQWMFKSAKYQNLGKNKSDIRIVNLNNAIVFNWNHFEIRLLNLRINFLFIADFLS